MNEPSVAVRLAALLLAALPGTARAEEVPRAATGTAALPEVTVTARKSPEDERKVPLQVSVLSARLIDDARVDDVQAVERLVPSLTYQSPNVLQNLLILRGVGNYALGEPDVGFFVDGVYLQPAFVSADLLDVERIEVLKGPQTALFGKSTIGGVVSVITRKPSSEPRVLARAAVGSQGLVRGTVRVSGPVAKDVLSARLAASFRQLDGFYVNDFDRRPLDHETSANVRLTLRATPTGDLDVTPSVAYRQVRGGIFTYHRIAGERDYRADTYAFDTTPVGEVRTLSAALPIDWRVLGDHTLSAVVATNFSRQDGTSDLDASAAPPDAVNPFSHVALQRRPASDDVSGEVRLASPEGGPFRWLAGAYAYWLRTGFEQRAMIETLIPIPPSGPVGSRTTAQTYSAFGRATWSPVEALELDAQLRYDHDERYQDAKFAADYHHHQTYDAVSPKGSVSYTVAPGAMAYASAALGYKAGGFNEGGLPPFGKERVTAYEVGAKTTWLGGRATLDAALFHIQLHEQQGFEIDSSGLVELTVNEGDAAIDGFEVEASVRPLDGLTLAGSLTVLDARYTDYTAAAISPVSGPGTYEFDGKHLLFVPPYEAAVSAQLALPVAEGVEALGRIDYALCGGRYWDTFNAMKQEPYGVLGASLGVRLGIWKVTAFGDNLLDERYFTYVLPSYRFTLPGSHVGVDGNPRSYGVMVEVSF